MNNLNEICNYNYQLTPEIIDSVSIFMSSESIGRRYLLGRNEYSLELVKRIDVDGVIDDFAEPGTLWNNIPVIKGDSVSNNAIVVNCSMSISPVTAHKRIKSLGIKHILAYADLCRSYPERFTYPSFVLETQRDLQLHINKWSVLRDSFSDDKSKQILDDLLTYRLSGNYRGMEFYSVRLQEQYFEEFLKLGDGEVFVDCGGYDGDTTEQFCRRCPGYEKIFIFEPSPTNICNAKTRLNGLKGIEFIQEGLSDSEGVLWFNPDAGSASSVSESGACQIQVTTLDQRVKGKVTFIKMDLEGWELRALEGAKRHIFEDHPKLAISVYHHPSDFWRVFEFVTNVRSDYDVFLRHYTEGWSETVMFFVPNGLKASDR